MAQTGVGPINLRINNANYVPPVTGSTGSGFGTGGNYVSIFALRARLQTLNAGYYTNERLNQLTSNDMVFALRNMEDATTIASYMTNSAA